MAFPVSWSELEGTDGVPICTHAGYGLHGSFTHVQAELCAVRAQDTPTNCIQCTDIVTSISMFSNRIMLQHQRGRTEKAKTKVMGRNQTTRLSRRNGCSIKSFSWRQASPHFSISGVDPGKGPIQMRTFQSGQ
jgi:hypothetical protein